jgi:2-dehydropantoate 2-reductase
LRVFDADAVLTENIWGYLWGKLAYGAMLFATALTPDSMSANFADPDRFPAFDTLAREVMAVALARGVTPIGFNGFDPENFYPGAPEVGARETVAALAAFNAKTSKTHSGIWRDLAVRKRKTEVDPQIGMIAALGREVGVSTPAIERLVMLIHDIEDGRRTLSRETLQALVEVCA